MDTLSIVIITKDTKDLLQQLLESIGRDLSLQPFLKEVIVVDNASTDGTDATVKDFFPAVVCIRNEKNRGFSTAVNQGASRSSGEYILLLNSDTIIIPGEIEKMLAYMEANKDVGVCGPQLVYQDMRIQRSFAAIPSLASEIVPRFLLHTVTVPSAQSAQSPLSSDIRHSASGSSTFTLSPLPFAAVDVPSLIGAAIMIRRSVFDMLSGFDERFFFFLEETDFCVRAKGAGYRVIFYPDAKVIHLQGKTVGKNWIQGRIEYSISLYKFIRKHHGAVYSFAFKAIRFFKAAIVTTSLSLLPFLLTGKKIRRNYRYYSKLLLWHLTGCSTSAGLNQ